MKIIIFLITFIICLNASSYKYSDIDMEVNFHIAQKNKKSKVLKYTSQFAIYYDETKEYKEKIFCFNDKEYIFVTKNTKKPKFKICIDKDNTTKIYVMDKSFRYQPIHEFDVKLKNILLTVKDKESKNSCKAEASEYNSLTSKINQCLKKI